MNKHNMKHSAFGFTLIELLVVIAIIGILAAIGITSFSGSQVKARDAKRAADVHQITLSLALYADSNKERFPIATTAVPARTDATVSAALGTVGFAVPKTPKGIGSVNDYWYISNATGSMMAVFTNNEKGSTWRVSNSKGFSGDVIAGADGSSPPLPSDSSQTVCSATDSGATGTQYQVCMSTPKIVENAGGGGCTPVWTCGPWTACCDNSQSRECTSSCGGSNTETQYCPGTAICP